WWLPIRDLPNHCRRFGSWRSFPGRNFIHVPSMVGATLDRYRPLPAGIRDRARSAGQRPEKEHRRAGGRVLLSRHKKVKEYNAVTIYQAVLATDEEMPKVGQWYENKLDGFAGGELLGVSVGGDLSRRSVFQDGVPVLPELSKRPVAVRG